jgi:hypothetical protein
MYCANKRSIQVKMLKNNSYNIDIQFDYSRIKDIVLKSLEKIAKEEALKNIHNNSKDNHDHLVNVNRLPSPPTRLLKLKIRNTTKYLNWRLWILNRDNFTCKICHTSVKENKGLRLEVHHPKAFDEICNENNVSTIEQALECKELWNINNGISICYRCHKDIEKLRTKLRNMFWLETAYT